MRAGPRMETDPADDAAERAASGSSFYLAMRLLPKERRNAMYAIYRFCRMVDDIADNTARSRRERLDALEGWRRGIDALYSEAPCGPVAFLQKPLRKFEFRKEDFLAVIDGMAMDVAEDICAPELSTLDCYCDRVASAVGRLSIKVFGMDEHVGFRLAHHLGRALQLTNVLRDLDEDAALGRLYLPREFLQGASLPLDDPGKAIAAPNIAAACRPLAGVARQHYRQVDAILDGRPRGELRPPRLMGAVYSRVLSRIESHDWRPPRRRIRLPKLQLLWLFLRHGLA